MHTRVAETARAVVQLEGVFRKELFLIPSGFRQDLQDRQDRQLEIYLVNPVDPVSLLLFQGHASSAICR